MAKKSKGFRELLKENHRSADRTQQSLNRFDQRFKQGPFGQKVEGIIQNPKGQVKMSEVLEAFVEPYLKEAQSFERQYALFELAIIAWNLAIMSEADRQTAQDELLDSLVAVKKNLQKADLADFLDELIDRKLKLFRNNRRLIMDFQLEDGGDQFHLSVASTAELNPR